MNNGRPLFAGQGSGAEQGHDLLTGTAGGRARWVDVEHGQLKGDMYCKPVTTSQVPTACFNMQLCSTMAGGIPVDAKVGHKCVTVQHTFWSLVCLESVAIAPLLVFDRQSCLL